MATNKLIDYINNDDWSYCYGGKVYMGDFFNDYDCHQTLASATDRILKDMAFDKKCAENIKQRNFKMKKDD